MELNCYKINPTGNVTLIVEGAVPVEQQAALAAELMKRDTEAEQVGFLSKPQRFGSAAALRMMGGEFCGNAAISAAALVMDSHGAKNGEKASVRLEISGADEPLNVETVKLSDGLYSGTLSMPLPTACFDCELMSFGERTVLPMVRLPGISHIIVHDEIGGDKAERVIRDWCRQTDSEALGLMFTDDENGLLRPLVYVEKTDSLVWESSCASGSVAVCAYRAMKSGTAQELRLRQPGGVLSVSADYSNGVLWGVKLSGRAEIVGRYSLETVEAT